MIILSHRGLDLEASEPLAENSLAALEAASQNGFGLEIDLQITADQQIIIAHDESARRWSFGSHDLKWNQLSLRDWRDVAKADPRVTPLCTLHEVFEVMQRFPRIEVAVHFKGRQDKTELVELRKALIGAFRDLFCSQLNPRRILVFDVDQESALELRSSLPTIRLAPSFAHAYDIARFQKQTHGTLWSLEEILRFHEVHPGVIDTIWLDEWDQADFDGKTKSIYRKEVVAEFKGHGLRTIGISPELHRQGEVRELKSKWSAMIEAGLDGICTDHPAFLRSTLASISER